jgi:hypothetical protein
MMQSIFTYLAKENQHMKSPVITTILMIVFTCLQSAWGYSPIMNLNGWDAARLMKAGITVTPWKHDQISDEPDLKWVEITYDSSKLGEDQNVLMSIHVTADNGQIVSAYRAEHKKGDSGKLKILFAVRKEHLEHSYLEILVPKLLSERAGRDFGDPGLGAYSLRLSRIMQLVSEASADKPIDER